jgi:uncharacterized protein YaeQ
MQRKTKPESNNLALKPTIYKAQVELADSDRGRYESLALTLARHPSETAERMAARLLSYCLNSDRGLEFTRGLSSGDEPDLWQHSDAGEIDHWIEVGQPDEGRLRKATGRAKRVSVYAFGKSAATWWKKNGDEISALPRLQVWQFPWDEIVTIAPMLGRSAQLSVSVVGGQLYIDNGTASATLAPVQLTAGE